MKYQPNRLPIDEIYEERLKGESPNEKRETVKMKPEISIIVPVYKVEPYLDRCINSILNQTFCDFELILVDDGSPDRCPQMCDEWSRRDERIRVVHKENGGLSSARNAGLDIALGKYLCFVDSDDWVAEDMCEYLLGLLQKYSADMVSTPPRICAGSVKIPECSEKIDILTSKEFVERLLKVHTRITEHYAWGKLYKADLWESIRFPENLIAEDVLGVFEVTLQADRVVCSNQMKYFYYQNSSGITGGDFTEKEFDLLEIWDRSCQKALKYGDPDIVYWTRMNRYRADFGLLCKASVRNIPINSSSCVRERLNACRKELKKHYWSLMKYSLPIDRKILLTLICLNYRLFCCCARGLLTISSSIRQKHYKETE